nr:tetratricopeptide repeat protein [Streptomyces sp. JH14]
MLRGMRQQRGLTIEELAEASGVSVRAIGDMERGRSRVPQRRTVAALAQGLGLADGQREVLLSAARAGRVTRAPAVAVAAVPPRSVGDFTGREAELAWLREAARRAGSGERAAVAVVSGPPGCGKTTLALKAAADLAGEFPGGCFVVDLHGVEGPMDTDEALLKLLKALRVPDRRLAQEDAEGRTGLLRTLLAEHRCLVVLDNARDEGQVRALLPGEGQSLVLVTSRRPLTGLEYVERLALSEMTQNEAVELLRRILGEQRADAEAEAVGQVARLCGRLPLALRVAGNWLTVRSGWSVDHLVRRLADEERRLGALAAGDVRVEAAFELSYRQLTGQAARMLRLLSLVPGPDMTAAYGAALTATAVLDAEDVMEELVEAGLLQGTSTGRYQLHDLLRLFARTRLSSEEEPAEQEAAEERLRSWLLDTAIAAGRWVGGTPPSSWQGLVPLESAEQARAWLESEAAAWLAALRGAARKGEHTRVAETAYALEWFAGLSGGWGERWLEVWRLASEAAAALDDPRLQALHLGNYSAALSAYGRRYHEALERADEALECARRAQDLSLQAWALVYGALAHYYLGEHQQAHDKARASVDLFEAAGNDHDGWLQGMTTYGVALRDLGRVQEALALRERVLAFLDAPDCPVGQHVADMDRAKTISGLGRDYATLGRWQEAAAHFRSGLLQLRRIGMPEVEGSVLLDLGQALLELGETDEARSCFRQVLLLGDAADSNDLKTARKLLDSPPAE